ncbi:MAG TPA: trigger factor [Halothiobacillus sp.]|nr:trigger factor [Halothiobacillus sp.]
MQVSVEAAEGLVRRLSIAVPAAEIDSEVERRLKDLGRRVHLNGFRPGKAPMPMVRQRYLAQVREEVVGEVLGRSYGQAVQEQNLRPAGSPQIESLQNEPGQDLSFVAAVEVYPEFEIGDLSKIEIERPVAEVTDADIDEMIEILRKQRAEWKPVKREAKEGDRVTVDFEGRLDGEPFDGGKGEGMPVVLGEGRILKDFEKGLMGVKADEERKIEVTFPEDYHAENLKGKTAEFTVKVTDVSEQVLPEFDDEFAKIFGTDNVDALREDVKKNMERELRQAIRRQVKNAVMEGLAKVTEVDLPNALVEEESRRVRDNFVQQQMGGRGDTNAIDPSLFKDEAERRVRLGLIVAELVKSADIRLDEERLEAFIDDIAAAYEEPEQVKRHYKASEELMTNARTVVIEDQVVDYVIERAKVTDKPMSFKDVMNPAPAAAA